MRKALYAAVIAYTVCFTQIAKAQDAVKIGVLNDQSGPYSEYGGLGSVEAASTSAQWF